MLKPQAWKNNDTVYAMRRLDEEKDRSIRNMIGWAS